MALSGREQFAPYQDDVLLPEIIAAMVSEYGYTEELAGKLHRDMAYYSYGLAILANTGHLNLTDEELLAAFRREFTALAAYYGVSPIPLKSGKSEKEGCKNLLTQENCPCKDDWIDSGAEFD